MAINQSQTQSPTGGETQDTMPAVDMNRQVSYSCQNGVADQSVFTPPTSVKFMDMAQMGMPTQ
jgi:hypothetical protein